MPTSVGILLTLFSKDVRIATINNFGDSMFECMIIGDSIAVGTAHVRTECVSHSVGGYNTWQWNKKFADTDLTAKSMIISLGTNDHKGVHTFKELSKMRSRVTAEHVFWIMPPCNDKFCKSDVNEIVEIIARSRGDTIIKTDRLQKDNIHPSWAGYKELANQSK
jgi:lysophospholipase L1-like esterase